MKEMLEKARNCTGEISNLSTDKKNKALTCSTDPGDDAR